MSREISNKQPVAKVVRTAEGVRRFSEYRAVELTAGESVVVSIKVNGVEVTTLGPSIAPTPEKGKISLVQARMVLDDAGVAVKDAIPKVALEEERG